jgi:hypothetical protein
MKRPTLEQANGPNPAEAILEMNLRLLLLIQAGRAPGAMIAAMLIVLFLR